MSDRPLPAGRLERDPGALFRHLLDGVLVVGTRSSAPVRITAPGDAVWEALAEPQTAASLVAALSAAFGAPRALVSADVAPMLAELLHSGAIRMVQDDASDR